MQQPQPISIEVYDHRGQRVSTIFNAFQTAGSHSFLWDGTTEAGQRLSAGVYAVLFQSNKYRHIKKVILFP